MARKKILIFSLAYYPRFVGGAEVAIKEITERLGNEFEFHMVTLRFDSLLPRVENVGNVLVHRIGFAQTSPTIADLKKFPLHLNKYAFQVCAVFKAVQLHRANRYDALWAMMAHSCGVPAAIFKLMYPRVPFLLTLQEGDSFSHIFKKILPAYFFFKKAFTLADGIQVISNYLAAWARTMGFRGEPIVIPNAVNSAHFSQKYDSEELIALKNKLGKKEGDVFLITTSRLVPKNAIADIVEALRFLPAHVKFLILGIGPLEHELKELSKIYNLESRIQFLGQVSHEEMPKYLRISDIFVRPSLSEGMGNSFIEAFAAGLPVIATQEGGIADFLFDSEKDPDKPTTGWAVDKNSPKQIADAVQDILKRPKKVREVVARAQELAFKKYDWDIVAKDMKEKVFDKIIADRK